MESNYDEDLSDNVFFKVLQTDYFELFEKATLEGWLICVPRAGSMVKYALTIDDFFSHILIPNDELPETHFRTLNGKDVRISNRVVVVESHFDSTYSTHVLFEETFYTSDMLKYKILCLESPLQQYSEGIKTESGIVTVTTLRDCIDLLWTESCREVLERMDDLISSFLSSNEKFEFTSLQTQKDLIGGLYTKCLQVTLKEPRLKEKTSSNRHLLDNVKVSVESYVHHGVYKKLIKGITGCTAYEDATFNKIVRNLSDLQLIDLNIGAEFESVIPKARKELRRIEGYSTVVGKVGCLRRTLSAISNQNSEYNQTKTIAADELLPMLVFLVIKSGLPNWIAHLTYMKEFSYSSSSYHSNQHNFLITSLEAAVTYIKDDLLIGPSEPESQIIWTDVDEKRVDLQVPEATPLRTLFEAAKMGSLEDVKMILEKAQSTSMGSFDALNLCHPLCSCDKCERELSHSMCNMAPTINSCDDKGFTVLHIASMYGQAKVIDYLLGVGANCNKSDYKGSTPLHYASTRGHQSAVLLLAHSGGKLDHPDNDGNTSLHLASSNGHETCIKALLYSTEGTSSKFDINFPNNQGDTPLHFAALWGYSSIVSILIDYGANPTIENKRKQTPMDLAHNMHLLDLLSGSKRSYSSLSRSNSIAAASTNTLDFCEEDLESSVSSSKLKSGVRPNSTDGIRKVERVIRAITYGDTRLACFYLGLELNSHKHLNSACHPLCSCKLKTEPQKSENIKIGEPLNVNVCDSEGLTPLHVSAESGRADMVKLLIDAQANINVVTSSNGMTPLHLAVIHQRTRVVVTLLETGKCDINLKDHYGNTPLHYSCQNGNSKLVSLILKHNPNIELRNNEGKSPLDEAKEVMSIAIIQLLNPYRPQQ